MNLTHKGFIYDTRSNKVATAEFKDALARDPEYKLAPNGQVAHASIKYLVFPISPRMVMWLPSQEGFISNGLKDFINNRLVYDIRADKTIALATQKMDTQLQLKTEDNLKLWRSLPINSADTFLTATNYNLDYRHGIITRPWWLANPANEIGFLATAILALVGLILSFWRVGRGA
jgi:hypothetical protein